MVEHLSESGEGAVAVVPLTKAGLETWLSGQPAALRQWAAQTGFKGEAGTVCAVPGTDGTLALVLFGLGEDDDPWAYAALPEKLAPGRYRIDAALDADRAGWAALGWELATYEFRRYRGEKGRAWPTLAWPEAADRADVERLAAATSLVRDLINTPSSDMGPEELAAAAEGVARPHGAACRVIVGDALLAENYPAIHAVGRASARAPRLIDMRWGAEDAPRVTLVGKGVCFDSGGLDLKPSSAMKLMKKDMGGAAHVLGLAQMVMAAGLPMRLRVVIPAVENSVGGDAFRPLDVLRTRAGKTVEIGNTDAEGRLVLCDALADADAEHPALLIDCATLTGAARSALGTEIPALFSNDDALADDLLRHGRERADPLWRLPLWKPYGKMLQSKVADLNNCPDGPYAGAITAALFLQAFVGAATPWAHLDMMAWNVAARPGRPEGGEAMGLRAMFALLEERFAKNG